MTPRPKVLDEITERLSRSPHVEKVILFGSRARGDARERSDIDLAVVGPNITRKEWSSMLEYIEEEAPTLLFVDLVRWNEASENMKKSIEREGIVLYERP